MSLFFALTFHASPLSLYFYYKILDSFPASYYWKSSVRITITYFCSCLIFNSISLCVLLSFFLSWPTRTNCCPTWVPLTCPTTAVMTCCLCSRTTDHHHLVTAVIFQPSLCFSAVALPSLVEDSTVSVGTNYLCVCVRACESECMCVNVYDCVVVYLCLFEVSCCTWTYIHCSMQERKELVSHVNTVYIGCINNTTEHRHWLCRPAF